MRKTMSMRVNETEQSMLHDLARVASQTAGRRVSHGEVLRALLYTAWQAEKRRGTIRAETKSPRL